MDVSAFLFDWILSVCIGREVHVSWTLDNRFVPSSASLAQSVARQSHNIMPHLYNCKCEKSGGRVVDPHREQSRSLGDACQCLHFVLGVGEAEALDRACKQCHRLQTKMMLEGQLSI